MALQKAIVKGTDLNCRDGALTVDDQGTGKAHDVVPG